MDWTLCARAFARRYNRVQLIVVTGLSFFGFCAPADTANNFFALFGQFCRVGLSNLFCLFWDEYFFAIGIQSHQLLFFSFGLAFRHSNFMVEWASSRQCHSTTLLFFNRLHHININDAIKFLALSRLPDYTCLEFSRRAQLLLWGASRGRGAHLGWCWRCQNRLNRLKILRVVYISHAEANATHFYNWIFLKFDPTLAFDHWSWAMLNCSVVMLHYQP